MNHPLQQHVEAVGRRAWRAMLAIGVGWTVVIGLSVALGLGLADYWIRFRDPGVRLICSAGLLAALGFSVWRFVLPVLRLRWPQTLVAQRIERLFPELQGRLASSIDFLNQEVDDPTAGSAQLRRTVVAETAAALDKVDLSNVFDHRETRQALLAASVTLAVVLLASACDVRSAALAAWRMVTPLGATDWPRRNQLEFSSLPEKLAAGGEYEFTVIDRNGSPPADATIWIWYDGDDASRVQRHLLRPLGETLVYRLDHVTKSFQFKATGGDDDGMAWQRVEVVEPPRVTKFQTRLVPPAYTGFSAETASQQIRAIVGTRIEVEATTDKPLAAVQLRTDGKEDKHETKRPNVPVRLTAGGSQFVVPADNSQPWLVTETRGYWFELTDLDGLRGGDELRWSVRAIPDQPPTVSVERPAPTAVATASAAVTLRALVKDDLAIHKITLRFTRSDQKDADEQSIELYLGADKVTSKSSLAGDAKLENGESRPVDFVWDLSQLPNLAAGTAIEFFIEAEDYKPQTGKSLPQRLAVISQDELDDKIAQRQALILSQLNEVLRLERDCRSQTTSLEIQLREAGKLGRQDVDLLQSAELNQRQVRRLLGAAGDGAQVQIASLLHDLETNRIANSDVSQRMTMLLAEIGRLNRDELPNIERELIAATKLARQVVESNKPNEASTKSLTAAGQRQDEVVKTLERLLGELSQWDHYRRFAREVNRLRRDQEKLHEQTAERLASQSLTKDPDKLSPQETADLKRLAERQQDLARRFDKLQSQMRQMRDELKESDPLSAQTLADALDAADRTAAGGDLRQAGQNLSQNRTGQATESQKKAAAGLHEIENVLANRREQELERIAKKLAEAAQELSTLGTRQTGLRKQMETAAKIGNEAARKRELQRLTKEQQRLAEDTARMARKLQRLQAQKASDATKQASGSQQQAGQAGEQEDAPKSLEEMQQAEKLLAEAQQQLAQERQQAEQDLANEQLVRLEQQIAGLLNRQKSVVGEIERLQNLQREQKEKLTAAQLASVQALAQQQRDLALETSGFATTIAPAEAFTLALRGVVREMQRSAESLERRIVGPVSLEAAQNAVIRLEQLLTALRPDKPMEDNNQPPPGSGDEKQPPPNQQSIHSLAELKLLRLMQGEINRRTSELAARRKPNGDLPADQLLELEQLADEQGRLANLVLNLVRQLAAQPAADSETPPELEPKNGDGKKRPPPASLDDLDEALKKSLEKK